MLGRWVFALGVSVWVGGCGPAPVGGSGAVVDPVQDRLSQMAASREIAVKNRAYRDAIGYDAAIAQIYLERQDEVNYEKWKDNERRDMANCGLIPDGAPKRDPHLFDGDELLRAMDYARAHPPKTDWSKVPSGSFRSSVIEGHPTAEQIEAGKRAREEREAEQSKAAAAARAEVAKSKALEAARLQKDKFSIAVASAPYRRWRCLGGREASEAKISDYREGVFTLLKRNGKTVDVGFKHLPKVDKTYAEGWLARAGVDAP